MAPVTRSTLAPRESLPAQKPSKRGRVSKKTKNRLRGVSEAVLFTTETLENILQHLPLKQLLVVQRVCHKFRAVITETKSLQQKLFLLPYVEKLCWNYSTMMYESNDNVSTSKISCGGSTGNSEGVLGSQECLFPTVPSVSVLNPMLLKVRNGSMAMFRDGPAETSQDATLTRSFTLSMDYPEASWRRMYLTQPPINSVEVWFAIGDSDRLINGTDGLRFGEVIDHGRKLEGRLRDKMQGRLFMFHFKEQVISEVEWPPGIGDEDESEDEWSD